MHSYAFVGIGRVPVDVLAEIFLFYLASGPSCSPWTLTAVSRTFRATAFSTRRLWSHITVTVTDGRYLRRWMDGSEQCNKPHRLQRALSRAAAAPLDIVINLGYQLGMRPTQEKRAITLLRTLFRTSSRWATLKVNDFLHGFDFRCLEKCNGSLGSFVMKEATPKRLIQAIDRSAPNLTTLEAENLQIKKFGALSWWSRLTTLSYKAHHLDNTPDDRIRILDYIARCTGLRKLTLSMGRICFTADEIALCSSKSLPNLRELYFINANCAMLFECPELTHLSYKTDDCFTTTTTIHNTNEFRLERLVYCKVESPLVGQYLAPLVAPNLQNLRIINAQELDSAFQKWWEERSGKPALEILYLEGVSLRGKMLKSTLEKMEGLKNLRLWGVRITKAELKTFAINPRARKRSTLCPKLVTLDVDCYMLAFEGIEPVLKEVAESRRIAGIPLESFRCHSSRCTFDVKCDPHYRSTLSTTCTLWDDSDTSLE
jgi:hypothetical protein